MKTSDVLPQKFCTLCGETLSDNLRTTRLEHDQFKHPDIVKKRIKQKKFGLAYFGIMACCIIFVIVGITTNFLTPYLQGINDWIISTQNIKAMDEKTLVACGQKVYEFEQLLHKQGSFTTDNAATMDDLIRNCNVGLSAFKYGSTIYDDKVFEKPYHNGGTNSLDLEKP